MARKYGVDKCGNPLICRGRRCRKYRNEYAKYCLNCIAYEVDKYIEMMAKVGWKMVIRAGIRYLI